MHYEFEGVRGGDPGLLDLEMMSWSSVELEVRDDGGANESDSKEHLCN
jgi:hypothetical protein